MMDQLLVNSLKIKSIKPLSKSSIKVICIILQITFVFFSINAQSIEHDQKVIERFEQAQTFYKNWENQKAIDLYEDLDSYFAEKADWKNWSTVFTHKMNLTVRSKNKGHLNIIEKNKNYISQLDSVQLGKYHRSLNYVYIKNGPILLAINHAKKALDIFKGLGDLNNEAAVIISLAASYSKFNDHQSAINYEETLQKMLQDEKYREAMGEDRWLNRSLNSHYNLSQFYSHANNYSAALIQAEKALTFENSVDLLLNKVTALNGLGKWDEANAIINGFGKLEELDPNEQLLIADVYRTQNRIQESLRIRKNVYQNVGYSKNRNGAKLHHKLAEAYFGNGELDNATKHCNQALELFCPELSLENEFSLPNEEMLIPEAYLMEALFLKAKIGEQTLTIEDKRTSQKQIVSSYQLAIKTLDLLRNSYEEIDSKLMMTETMSELYMRMIKFVLNSKEDLSKISNQELAYDYLQSSKAFALRESISKREAFKLANVPKEQSAKYFSLINKSNDSSENYLEQKDSITKLQKKIQSDYPDAFSLTKKNISLSNTQNKLSEDRALLNYFVFRDELICFVILKNNVSIFEKKLDDDFFNAVETYTDILHGNIAPDKTAFFNTSKKIKNAVLGSTLDALPPQINHLTIIPSGIIHKLSFQNLPKGDKNNWSDVSETLLFDYAFNYLHFAKELNKDSNPHISKSICIGLDYKKNGAPGEEASNYSTTLNPDSLQLNHLPNAKLEVERIAKKLNANLLVNKTLNLNKIQNIDHLHFAGHCIIDTEDHRKSFIPFYNENGKVEILTYTDIQSLNNNPAMVVLSACNTNNGKSLSSEGMFSMSRVFTETGAASVLGSKWNTPDKPSLDIADLFYENLLTGERKAQALRKAILHYLSSDDLSTPELRNAGIWSNWTLYGLDEAVVFSKAGFMQKNKWILILGGGLLALSALLLRKRNKSKPTTSF